MKVLSIKQPWAWLIVNGIKDIENRTWKTNFRGQFFIHASQSFDYDGYKKIQNTKIINHLPKQYQYEFGGIIGITSIIDCVIEHQSIWFTGPYGFVLQNSKPVKFHRLRGQMGFFDIDEITSNLIASSILP